MNDEDLMTPRAAAELAGLRVYPWSDHISTAMARGEIERVKIGRRWMARRADIETWLSHHASLREAGERVDLVEALRAEVARLKATLRDARSSEHITAEQALMVLSLDESLAILARIDTSEWRYHERTKVYDATRQVQHQIDERDAPAAVGIRPPRVPERASHRRITTGIGPVDIWYWTYGRNIRSWIGGPRARLAGTWPGVHEAIKNAGRQARYEYGKPVRKSSARLRFQILSRDNFTCQYCGRKAPDVVLHVDHRTPIAEGGSNEPENLVTACADCNLGKNDVLLG